MHKLKLRGKNTTFLSYVLVLWCQVFRKRTHCLFSNNSERFYILESCLLKWLLIERLRFFVLQIDRHCDNGTEMLSNLVSWLVLGILRLKRFWEGKKNPGYLNHILWKPWDIKNRLKSEILECPCVWKFMSDTVLSGS